MRAFGAPVPSGVQSRISGAAHPPGVRFQNRGNGFHRAHSRANSTRVLAVSLPPKQIKVNRIMGEGSFGQVFEGTLSTAKGNEKVVMKRVKAKVEGAEEMHEMELALNQYAAKAAKGHCADFLGYCSVSEEESRGLTLTPGLWLMWRYEGSKTLDHYLRRRDCIRMLAQDLQVPEEAAVATVMKQLFESLAAFHAAGLVHRDVKPLNIIFAEKERRFKLIDLGACADLRSGKNYVPDESILDPQYAPPEKYVLPTDSPHLSKSFLKMAVSPMLWARHNPDRFDMWSAGMVLLQLGLPSMRSDRSLQQFNATYGSKYDYDLTAWRKGSRIPSRDLELLDADDGAGWELLQALLRERSIRTDEDGHVSFTDREAPRMPAAEALKHRFMSMARVPGSVPLKQASFLSSSRGRDTATNMAVDMWRGLTGRMFDLEAKINAQTSATNTMSVKIKRLKQQVASGQASSSQLAAEEQRLKKMEKRLGGLQQDLDTTASAASGLLRFFGLGGAAQGGGTGDGDAKVKRSGTGDGDAKAKSRSGSSGSGGGVNMQVWQQLAQRMAQVEAQLNNQESAVVRQSFTVKKLQREVTQGATDPDMLRRAERILARMERRLDALAKEKAQTKEQATGLAAMFGSFFSSLGGTTDKVTPPTPTPPPPPPPPPAKKAPEPAGSLWGSLFGGSKAAVSPQAKAATAAPATSQAPAAPAAPAPAPPMPPPPAAQPQPAAAIAEAFRPPPPPARAPPPAPPPAPVAAAPVPAPAAPAAPVPAPAPAASPKQASAPGGLFGGWGGMAGSMARMAGNMAQGMMNIREDAQRMLREMEAAEEAKRLQRANDAVFVSLLRDRLPAVTSKTTYEELVESSASDPRFNRVDEARRRLQLALYQETQVEAELQAKMRARTMLKALFKRSGLSENSQWADVKVRLSHEPAFRAVESEEERALLFYDCVEELAQAKRVLVQAEKERQAAVAAEKAWREAAALYKRQEAEAAAAAAAAERTAAAAKEAIAAEAAAAAAAEAAKLAAAEVAAAEKAAAEKAAAVAAREAAEAEAAKKAAALATKEAAEASASQAAVVAAKEAADAAAAEAAAAKKAEAVAAKEAAAAAAAEAAAAAVKVKQAEADYMEMLAGLEPALAVNSEWSQIESRIMRDARYAAVGERRRRELFDACMQKVAEKEQAKLEAEQRQAAMANEAAERERIAKAWAEKERAQWRERVKQEAADRVKQEAAERERAAREKREAEAAAAASAADAVTAERDFLLMLAGLSPAITANSLWPHVKSRILHYPSYKAVAKDRHRDLFEVYMTGLREAASAAAQADVEAGRVKAPLAAKVDLTRLDKLREDQARLRTEYEKFESILENMEKLMQTGGKQPQQSAVPADHENGVIEEDAKIKRIQPAGSRKPSHKDSSKLQMIKEGSSNGVYKD